MDTTRLLNSTLPFDENKAILFVRGGQNTHVDKEEFKCPSLISRSEVLSGSEARRFYEDVISLPGQSVNSKEQLRRRRKKKNSRKKVSTAKITGSSPVSVCHVFRLIRDGDLEGVKSALCDPSCDVNSVDQFQWTFLMSAAHAGRVHIVEYLLSRGAKWKEYVDKSGRNAADLARLAGHLSLACFIENSDYREVDAVQSNGDCQRGKHSMCKSSKTPIDYCHVCKQAVTDGSAEHHMSSTVHQFSCQYRPQVGLHSYAIPQNNRGYQMMLKEGWNPDKGLGPSQEGQKYPVKTVLKQDRLGLGLAPLDISRKKARVTHFAAFDMAAVKRSGRELAGKAHVRKKKDIIKEAHKDKSWEASLRRYMNTEYKFS